MSAGTTHGAGRRRWLRSAGALTALGVLGTARARSVDRPDIDDTGTSVRAQSDESESAGNGTDGVGGDGPRRVMWGAALMAHPLAVRLEAVAASGFTHMTVFPADMKRWRRDGLNDTEISRMIRDSGVEIATIDPYTGWVPGWSMEGVDDVTREFIDVSEAEMFRMANALEAERINAVQSVGDDYELPKYADALGAFGRRGEHQSRQSVGSAVGELDGFSLVDEGLKGQHRAEYFALHDLAGVRCWFDECWLVMQRIIAGLPAPHDGVAVGTSPLDEAVYRGTMVRMHHRSDVGAAIAAVAEHQRIGVLVKLGKELVANRFFDQQSCAGQADLSRVIELPCGAVSRSIEIRIGKHDQRALAAKLSGKRHDVLGGCLADMASGLG